MSDQSVKHLEMDKKTKISFESYQAEERQIMEKQGNLLAKVQKQLDPLKQLAISAGQKIVNLRNENLRLKETIIRMKIEALQKNSIAHNWGELPPEGDDIDDSTFQNQLNLKMRCLICDEHPKSLRCPQCHNGFCSNCHHNMQKNWETMNKCPFCRNEQETFQKVVIPRL